MATTILLSFALVLLQGQDCGRHNPAASPKVMCALRSAAGLTHDVVCVRESPLHSVGQAGLCHLGMQAVTFHVRLIKKLTLQNVAWSSITASAGTIRMP